MTTEEAIKSIERHIKAHHIGEYPHVFIGVALEMAIAALRAQKAPAKLDRSRWKGCRLCRGQESDYWYYGVIKFNFCPNCGFPCTEAARAELERRIGGDDETAY